MYYKTCLAALLAAVLATFAAPPVRGQEPLNVTIQDGEVSINGKVLDDDAVPEALRSFDGNVSFTYNGDEDPILGLGDELFLIEGDRIVLVPSHAPHLPNFFRFGDPALPDPPPLSATRPGLGFAIPSIDSALFDLPDEFFGDPARFARLISESNLVVDSLGIAHMTEATRQQAERMRGLAEEIRNSVPPPGGRVRVYHAPSKREEPGEDVAERLEDERIRMHLQLEKQLDLESRRIASEIAQLASEDLRRELERDLRSHLDEAFELRQENRRKEIRELESRLNELQERLERREELRERIIEERVEFLLREHGAESER